MFLCSGRKQVVGNQLKTSCCERGAFCHGVLLVSRQQRICWDLRHRMKSSVLSFTFHRHQLYGLGLVTCSNSEWLLKLWISSTFVRTLEREPARRKACTSTGQYNTERRGETSMLWVGFESTVTVFKRPYTARPLWSAVLTFMSYQYLIFSFRD
jgi:hypothetical protein